MNTIALAYVNKKGEVVAWSADTFGSPRDYPKTYRDTEANRTMLLRKLDSRKEASGGVDKLKSANPVASALLNASEKRNDEILEEKAVVAGKIALLDLITDYEHDFPKWEQVKQCIDNKKYTIL